MSLKAKFLASIHSQEIQKLHVATTRDCNYATLDTSLETSNATFRQLDDAYLGKGNESDATLDATSMQQLRIFTQLGLDKSSAVDLIAQLRLRDADWDSRFCCFECSSISRISSSEFICTNARNAGVMSRTFSLGDGANYAKRLQRCDGFTATLNVSKF